MKTDSKEKGFTLLEILVSFAILASVLTVVIQSQSDMVFFLKRTDQLGKVQSVVINKLLELERTSIDSISSAAGEFPNSHPLAGKKWNLTRQTTRVSHLVSTEMEQVTYQVYWTEKGIPQTYELSIYK